MPRGNFPIAAPFEFVLMACNSASSLPAQWTIFKIRKIGLQQQAEQKAT
jgi:hypothetical protein